MKGIFIVALLFTLFTLTMTATATCTPVCTHGTCQTGNACNCTGTGYTGSRCQQPVCSPQCTNGKCVAPNTCNCSVGWTDSICSTITCDINGCSHGTCIGPSHCNCSTGWSGAGCNIAQCTPGCENNGVCSSPDVCECDQTGWEGSYCQIPICNSTLGICEHGSYCVGPGSCNCSSTGYAGSTCNFDVNECLLPNTTACDKKTTCTNTVGSYKCSACPSGYVGDGKTGCFANCPYGCANGGYCSGPAKCNCTGTGYTGSQCFTDLDECTTGGYCSTLVTCINTIGSYECGDCPDSYSGSGYISEGGCTPQCNSTCPSGQSCIGPNTCGDLSSAARLMIGLIPILMFFLILV